MSGIVTHFENRVFTGENSWSGVKTVTGFQFNDCRFESCFTAPVQDPQKLFVVRDVIVRNCTEQACSLSTARFENILVDGLLHAGRHLPTIWACLFNRVTIRGVVAAPKINEFASPFATSAEKAHWRAAAHKYYRDIDWALDLREARFKSVFDLPGVPARLIRRDPETQFVIRRETVLAAAWQPAEPSSVADVVVSLFLASGLTDVVAVVGKASRKFHEHLASFQALRNCGVVEPD